MLKLATLTLASAVLLASGCAAHDQRVALQQKCDNGDQNACQQIAQNEEPPGYPGPPNVRVFPAGQSIGGIGVGAVGGMSGMGGMGGMGGVGGVGK
jgi:hypothetical protein